MEELKGYVDHLIFHNKDNGYSVINFIVGDMEITVTGIFPGISEGENLLLKGEYISHPTYGQQFKATSFKEIAPEDAAAMEHYLASGAIKGIGPKLASRIVKEFGDDTFRVMEEEPELLSKVKGISESMAMSICDQVIEKKELREAMIFLEKYGIRNNLAVRIFQKYGSGTYAVVRENPYRLAEDIHGVGFKIADEIAQKVGINVDSEFRIRSAILYMLTEASAFGHTYLPKEMLLNKTSELISIAPSDIEPHITNLAIDRKVIVKEDKVFHQMFYRMEDRTAGLLLALDEDKGESERRLLHDILDIEKRQGFELDEIQRTAVVEAISNGVFILTGGPGTGKTTTIRVMIEYFLEAGLDIMLAAPTGRAAKRMSEATGYEAKTIHRMLEVNGGVDDDGESTGSFERNATNPLEADVIIVDEVSMVDITLMYSLIQAIQEHTRLILVGDTNQLPSVGPGNVLRDLIASNAFSVVKLEKIFRQSDESDIVLNAHKINQGEVFKVDNKSKDFFLLKRNNSDAIISVLLSLIQEKFPKYVDCKPLDIQVLTPTRKGLLGVERLNVVLQEYLNPPADDKPQHESGERIFRLHDKVMQIKNNYQLEWEILGKHGIPIDKGMGVFNGDMGEIIEINDFAKTITVSFDEGRQVDYPFKQLDEMELAYAVTIHKSQGSEYPAVLIPLLPGPQVLMNRNLLYTAVTRAQKCVAIVGDEETFEGMIKNTSQQNRFSGLTERLIEKINM